MVCGSAGLRMVADRRIRRSAGAEEHVERLAALAARDDLKSSSLATALTARSLNLFCHQRFSPVHSMAGNLAPHTPAWTFSSILASTKPFLPGGTGGDGIRRAGHRPDAGGSARSRVARRHGTLFPVREFDRKVSESVDQLLSREARDMEPQRDAASWVERGR